MERRLGESGFVDTNGARLYYEAEGTGHPLVMIHSALANLRQWDEQVPALADQYRVIRYDIRGFGRTETDQVEFSNRADIAALMDFVGADSAYVLGTSRGGMIALDFALERTERVDALIIVAGGIGGYEAPTSSDGPAPWDEAERLFDAKDWAGLADWETAYWVDGQGQAADRVDPAVRRRVHDWILSGYQAEKAEGIPQPLKPPAVGRIGRLNVPTLVIVGDLDDAGTQAACRKLADEVPGARFELFPGVAHMINLEQPERFNALLLEFLAEADLARPQT